MEKLWENCGQDTCLQEADDFIFHYSWVKEFPYKYLFVYHLK